MQEVSYEDEVKTVSSPRAVQLILTQTACSNTPTLFYIKGLSLFSFQLWICPMFSLLIL